MAFRFKIQNNFFVVIDDTDSSEAIRELKEQLKFTANVSDVFVFHFKQIVENGSSLTFVVGGEQSTYPFADILDDTGTPFASVDALKIFLSTNLGT